MTSRIIERSVHSAMTMNHPSRRLILASASKSRAALLTSAGLDVDIEPSGVDEKAVRSVLENAGGSQPADVAEVLARAKAEAVSDGQRSAIVIGADQILALEDRIFEKPGDMAGARRTILDLSGKTHQLHACVAVAVGGETVWAYTGTADMTMRALTPEFVGTYLAEAGEAVLGSVGAYLLEAHGVHLFENIEGDYFTVLGLPLLPLLDFLRRQGAVLS